MGQAINCFAAVNRLYKGISIIDLVRRYFSSSQRGLPRLFWNNDRLGTQSQLLL